jgi:hypothetical protein
LCEVRFPAPVSDDQILTRDQDGSACLEGMAVIPPGEKSSHPNDAESLYYSLTAAYEKFHNALEAIVKHAASSARCAVLSDERLSCARKKR